MEKESSHLTDFFAHVLFVIAQSYCGAFLVLLLGPLVRFLWSTDLTVESLLTSFPAFWVLAPTKVGEVLVAAVLAYPIGLVAAELFYHTGRLLGLHNDLNLETDSDDADEKQRIELFRRNCQIQESPSYARIWEWENFQSAVFFYAEWISLTFTALYSVSIAVALFHAGAASGATRSWILAGVLWAFSLVFFLIMRRARISKYQSFRLAHRAIKELLAEKAAARPPRETGD